MNSSSNRSSQTPLRAVFVLLLSIGERAGSWCGVWQYLKTLLSAPHHGNHCLSGAIPPLGAFVGSMMSGPVMQRAGRKRTLQMAAPLWAAGWLLLGFAPSFPLVLLGRFTSGLCVGFTLAPSQVYVSECCDPEIRGRLGSLPTLSMSLGIVISYVAGNWLYWRHLAFLSATFCGALFLVLLPLPESPVWLDGRGLDSSSSVKWLQLSSRAVAVVKDDVPEKPVSGGQVSPPSLFTREVFFSSSVIKPLVVGFSLLFFQQFSGIDTVIFFTVEIFQSAGSTINPMMATILVGVVQLVCNGVSTMVVDRAGRRPLLLLSAAVMCGSMLAMGTAYYLELQHVAWLGYLPVGSLVVFMVGFSLGFGGLPFLLLGELFPAHHRSQLSAMASAVNLLSMFTVIKSFHALETVLTSAGTFWMYACFCALAFFFVLFMVPETKGKSLAEIEQHFRGEKKSNAVKLQTISTISYLPVGSLVVFMVGFSLGFGGLPFLLLGELFPAHHRSQLSAMASAVNLLSMFTVIKSFHALETVLTSAGTFWMYACFCALAFFFVLFMVPETKGKSLAEIEQHFRGEKKSNAVKLQTISTIS